MGLGPRDKGGTAWGCFHTVKAGLPFTFKVQEQLEPFTELHSENINVAWQEEFKGERFSKGGKQKEKQKQKEKVEGEAANSKHWGGPELSLHFGGSHYWRCCSSRTHTLFPMVTGFLSDLPVRRKRSYTWDKQAKITLTTEIWTAFVVVGYFITLFYKIMLKIVFKKFSICVYIYHKVLFKALGLCEDGKTGPGEPAEGTGSDMKQ